MTTLNSGVPAAIVIPAQGNSSGASLRASSSSITGMPSWIGKARRSGLQTGSCLLFMKSSGPLHTGQTRMSSSLGSMPLRLQFAQDQFTQRSRDLSRDGQHPHVFVAEALAFYRIFFGDDDGVARGEAEIRGAERMAVGKGVGEES